NQTKPAIALQDFVAYIPIMLPSWHSGVLTVTSSLGSVWNLEAYTTDGYKLYATKDVEEVGGLFRTVDTFIAASGDVVYLRAQIAGTSGGFAVLTFDCPTLPGYVGP